MSNPLKKITKGIKKVFKKVVKVVKKIVQSKIFKVVAIAVAVYFTAGAAAGYFGSAATLGNTAGWAAAETTAASTLGNTAGWAAAETVAAGASASAAAAAPTVAAATGATGLTAGKALLASSALTTGGSMLSAYAQGQREEEFIKSRDRNSKHKVDIYGMYNASMKKAGMVKEDSQGRTEYGTPAIDSVSNVDSKPASYYNSSNDSWSPVQKVAQSRNTNKDAGANV